MVTDGHFHDRSHALQSAWCMGQNQDKFHTWAKPILRAVQEAEVFGHQNL